MNTYFKAQLSTKLAVVTYILVALTLLISVGTGILVFQVTSETLGVLIALLGIVIILGTRAFVTNGFRITSNSLVVERWVKSFSIPLSDIAEVRVTNAMEVLRGHMSWRLFGDGGLWGAHGLFYNKNLGKFYIYLTDEKNVVHLIQKNGTHIFLSPSTKEAFADALKNACTQRGNIISVQ
jgi:hypothetical protein